MKLRHLFLVVMVALAAVVAAGCGGGGDKHPLQTLAKEIEQYPAYDVILEGMENNKHQYRIVYAETKEDAEAGKLKEKTTEWRKVHSSAYESMFNYFGMTVMSRELGEQPKLVAQPAGYRYVGNSHYGHWNNGLWVWGASYLYMSSMYRMGNTPIGRADYDGYRSAYASGKPYYGANKQYGTFGSTTRTTHKSFFDKNAAKIDSQKATFAKKAAARQGRSSTSSTRSRSSSSGGK